MTDLIDRTVNLSDFILEKIPNIFLDESELWFDYRNRRVFGFVKKTIEEKRRDRWFGFKWTVLYPNVEQIFEIFWDSEIRVLEEHWDKHIDTIKNAANEYERIRGTRVTISKIGWLSGTDEFDRICVYGE